MEDLKGPSMETSIYYVGLACSSCSRCSLPEHPEHIEQCAPAKTYSWPLSGSVGHVPRPMTQKQTIEGCLRSLLRHLSARELPATVEALHKQAQERNTQPGLDALMDVLKAVLRQAGRTFIVFDALDECKEVKLLMEKIAEIKRWELPGVCILATSRREPDIVETMDVLLPQSICLETALVDEDIRLL